MFLEVIVTGFKTCYISNAEAVGNVGSEHRVSSECETEDGNCEDTKAETDDRNGEHSETGEGE
jgi:hypothetical protein